MVLNISFISEIWDLWSKTKSLSQSVQLTLSASDIWGNVTIVIAMVRPICFEFQALLMYDNVASDSAHRFPKRSFENVTLDWIKYGKCQDLSAT